MKYIWIPLGCLLLFACSKKTTGEAISDTVSSGQIQMRMIGGYEEAMPQATIIKIDGNYADKVAVTLNPDGTLAYYPAPTDIMTNSAPYALGDGWYLNRQGISKNSVFTKWTFDEYRNLASTPSREDIIEAIIPGSGVIEMEKIPLTISEALSNPSACKKYVTKE